MEVVNDRTRTRVFEAMKHRILEHLARFPEEHRQRVMSDSDRTDAHGAALFIAHVSHAEDVEPEELGAVLNTYAEILWMIGYERGYAQGRKDHAND